MNFDDHLVEHLKTLKTFFKEVLKELFKELLKKNAPETLTKSSKSSFTPKSIQQNLHNSRVISVNFHYKSRSTEDYFSIYPRVKNYFKSIFPKIVFSILSCLKIQQI